jgi:predicted polyphosphate/ATP-dependent NAD kinase
MFTKETTSSEIEKEQVLTAWRSMLLKEAELEDKMDAIHEKNDLELYHCVKMMEMARIEDSLYDEFSVLQMDLWQLKQSIGTDEQTTKFEDDLRKMLD